MTLLIGLSLFAGRWMRVYFFPVNFIFLPIFMKILILTGIGLLLPLIFYLLNNKIFSTLKFTNQIVYFMGSMWLLPFLTRVIFIPSLKIGSAVIKYADQGWMEFLGGQGFINKAGFVSTRVDFINLLNLKFYLFIFFITVTILVFIRFYLNSLKRASRWSCEGNFIFLNVL
jgi:hypothetical protein